MQKLALALLLTWAAPALAQRLDTTTNPFGSNGAPTFTPSAPAPPVQLRPRPNTAAAGPDALATSQQSCGSDPVVWGNSSSRVYHRQGDRYFGKTRRGAYLCQAEAERSGYHAAGQPRGNATAAPSSTQPPPRH